MQISLADMTDRPYFPQETRTRLVNAINYAAAYEAAELADLNDAIGEEMDSWDMTGPDYNDDVAAEMIEKIISIASDHGYSIECLSDYPGFWVITDSEEN